MLFAIVVADGAFSSGFTLLHDTLTVAEVLRGRYCLGVPEIELAVLGEESMIRTGSGLAIPTTGRLDDMSAADVIVVPALNAMDEDGMKDALRAPATMPASLPVDAASPAPGCAPATAGLYGHYPSHATIGA